MWRRSRALRIVRNVVAPTLSNAAYAKMGASGAVAVTALDAAGADSAARNVNGKTALQTAKEKGHAECVEAFKKHVQEVVAGRVKSPFCPDLVSFLPKHI